jgi:hypothetical protein
MSTPSVHQSASLIALAMLLWVGAYPVAKAQQHEAASDGDRSVTYSPHAAKFTCHMNMGPTGATAWMRGYHFVVMSIQQGSPARGTLMLGDVVVGADGRMFGPETDPRITLGRAIGDAEATGQPLKLHVLREMTPCVVSIALPPLGAYAATWPEACDKSRRILDQACQSLLDSQLPDGQQVTDGAFGTFTSGLLFLATGESEYLDAARRAAYKAASLDYATISYNNWAMGYGGLLLAEYYLATGDDSVLAKLEEVAGMIAAGQMRSGTWGHKSPAAGYGALNQTGLVTTMTLLLARECGVAVDDAAIDHALNFFRRYAGTGSVPYGDHRPGNSLDDNGKNAMAAVLFHLAGEADVAADFAASVAVSYWQREEGHTGGLFSIIWGPLGAALAEQDKQRAFLDYQTWYYDLARQWHGAFTLLPYHEALTRFDDSGYIYGGGPANTGGIALAFALPARKLRILGAPPSVFAAELSGDLKLARNQYLARDWTACDATLAAIDPADLASDDERRRLDQLRQARDLALASTEHVLMEIDANLTEGAAYRASQQFEALKRCLGEAGDPRFADLDNRFADSVTAWHVREGRQFYERWEGMLGFAVKSWVPQGPQAKRMLEGVPSPRLPIWEPLSPTSHLKPQPWRTVLLDVGQSLPPGWEQTDFDDADWHAGEGILTRFEAPTPELQSRQGPIAARRRFTVETAPAGPLRVRVQTVRNAVTRVYLNGTLIAHIERGNRGGYADIPLHASAGELLRLGDNVLAITATEQGRGSNQLDVGLEINRRGTHPRHLPIERATVIDSAALPDVDTSLRVSDAMQRYRDALRQSYHDMALEDLVSQLGEPIAYHRSLAEDALVARGLEGVRPATDRHADDDWRVRAAVLSVIRKARKQFADEHNEAGLDYLAQQIPMMIERVGDEHLWVRTQACHALGDFATLAKDAIPALRRAANDPQEWVRQASLAALHDIGADHDHLLDALQQAVATPNSSFGIPKLAVAAVKQPAGPQTTKLSILIDILKHPPEGGGGSLLVELIDLACRLDPDGVEMIPVLIDAAADKTHLSRQRGNPRGKAIQALGDYGDKATAAIDALRAILADDTETGRLQHEAAAIALRTITGKPE